MQRAAWLRAMEPIEPIRFVGMASPAALLFQNGRNDPAIPMEEARRFHEAGSSPKTILWYDAGHDLPRQAIEDRGAWLAEQIGIDASKLEWK